MRLLILNGRRSLSKAIGPSNCISKFHGRLRFDEYASTFKDKKRLTELIEAERQNYQTQSNQWKEQANEYISVCSQRTDSRTTSSPQVYGAYSYFTEAKRIEGRSYTTLHRQKQGDTKELVLDIMQYANIRRYARTAELVRTSFSPSHNLVAFACDLKNNEKLSFMVKDIKNNRLVSPPGWTNGKLYDADTVVFQDDNSIFYTELTNHRPSKVYFQRLDSEPQLIYEEQDPQFWLGLTISKDQGALIVSSNSKAQSEIKYIDLTKLSKQPTTIRAKAAGKKIVADRANGQFILWQTTSTSTKVTIGLDQPRKLYECQLGESITEMDVFKSHVVLYGQFITRPFVKIVPYSSTEPIIEVKCPYEHGSVFPNANKQYACTQFQIVMNNSFVYDEVYSVQLNDGSIRVKEKFQLNGPKFVKSQYTVTLHEAPTVDGQKVPMTVISRKGNRQPTKTMLNVYGFYGLSNQVAYSNTNLVALESGWTIVYAHVRGGSQKGQHWHKSVLGANRDVTWRDLQSCVAYLFKHNITHPSLLVLQSHSAGAIAVWNTINNKPHLYKGAVLHYPFLDVLTTLLDPTQALSQSDYPEFGNPIVNDSDYERIQSICPYENIQRKDYPFLFVLAGEQDYRCQVETIAKFVQRYRDRVQTSRRYSLGEQGLIVRFQKEASHNGVVSASLENRIGCQILAMCDHLIDKASHDVLLE